MAEHIQFRVRLTESDWDSSARVFRCSALALPGAEVTAIHVAGRALRPSDFGVEPAAREIRYLASDAPPAELAVTIQVAPLLTTWRKAGISSGVAAILTALIAAVAQYSAAVVPARISANAAREQLQAAAASGAECQAALKARSDQLAELELQLAQRREAEGKHNATHGDASPIVQGGGTVSIQHRSR